MPIGPFGEIIGTTGTLECLGEAVQNYKTKVVAPRNPKLMKGEQPEFKMKPSQFMFQMSMNTEQKLANMHTMNMPHKKELLDMSETTHQKVSNINIDEPMFQPFPSEVFFQNYEPFETYEVPLVLRNNDKVPRLVKVIQQESPYFKIISPHNVGHKVGPGLPTTFRVQFVPEEKKDYYHELTCITEREKFVVPVRAIGSRAVLDFPDEVRFQDCPVKYSSSKTLLVRNVGNAEAKFSLSTESPFIVSPQNGTLAVNESMQIHIEFKPTTSGDHYKDLVLHYDTVENVYIQLYGVAHDANVRLDKNSIRIENTYLSMANQRTVTITNRSNVIANFKWSQFATKEEEAQQRKMFAENLQGEEKGEKDRFLEECIQDPSLRDKMAILSRTFHNKRRLVTDDKMIFEDDVVKIEPIEGEIWPNSSMEVNIIFNPESAKTYTRTAFCDITGRESRLPLRIRGDGIGPKVQFSYDTMDMGNIFVNSTHTYEVILANKGDIDAIFNLIPMNTVFGPCFNFNPSEGIVMPDGHQAIQITFSSAVLGEFKEEFLFQIDGSPHKLKLVFSGIVIGPTFHFDVPKLKFGTVSYGFTSTQTCTVVNTALVPMKFTLRVPGDGNGDASIASTADYDSTVSEAGSMLPPREFEVSPSEGRLAPQSETRLKVDLCSNTVKKYDLSLVVDVEGVGDEVVRLPVTARCIVPQITVMTPILDYGRCFLRHPYEHHVKLQNDTDLPAKYELLPQLADEFTAILYTSPQPKGILEPHSVTDVPMVITPQALEELEVTAHFIIFGSSEASLPVHIHCVGEGPVVHVMPLDMDWGQIPVLVDSPKTVRLSNESLIPAKFTAHMTRPNTVWRVEPDHGEIPPEEQMDLTITACLDDCVRFNDKMQISFIDGHCRTIPVTGYGYGTTIVADPPMSPLLNLGPHFSKGVCSRSFTLTNMGRRHQSLVWSTEGFSLTSRPLNKRHGSLAPINSKDMKFKDNPPPPEPPKPIFKLTPQRLELNPGESKDVLLEGLVDNPQVVKEKMLCHAIIGRAGGKELIMKVNVNCEFISPLLEFSTEDIFFRVDKLAEDQLTLQTKELELTNISSLPLTAQFSLVYPFQLIGEDGVQCSQMDITLGIGEDKKIIIQFDPAYIDDSHIRIIDEVLSISYSEHPHVDQLALRGEVYFPNLEFEKSVVDFGCILNDTEVTRYLNIRNNSPMDVKYKWSFLFDGQPIASFHPRPKAVESPQIEEMDEVGEVEVEEDSEREEVEVEILVEGASSPTHYSDGEEQKSDVEKQLLLTEDNLSQKTATMVESDGEEKKDEEKPVMDETEAVESHPKEGSMEEGEEGQEVEAEVQSLAKDALSIGGSRPVSQALPQTPQPAINPALAQLLEDDKEKYDLGPEEIFDILPLYGTLKPGDTEQITMTFFGHADISSGIKAVCEVIGGPTYEVTLKGEASLVEYRFDCLDIDYGKIMYDHVSEAEITLVNTGRVGFEFCALGMDPGMAAKPKPGVPVMIPHKGFIEPNSEQTLVLKFLPGIPECFHKNFQLQVAHFEPDTVNLFGEGVFPRISLDLPRLTDPNVGYEELVKEARENLTRETKKVTRPMSGVSAQRDEDSQVSELEIQMEVERMVVQEFAVNQQDEASKHVDVLTVDSSAPPTSKSTRDSSKKSKKKNRPKARLPEYVLDFGHVVLGTVRTHIVRATNTGWFPCSFVVDHAFLHQYGFGVELDRVKQLPGAPDHETVDFVITFDPRGANLNLGEVETVVPINIMGGPQVCILLRANVTMPDMQISKDVLEFGEVQAGECKVITVQIYNHKHVRCEWNSLPTDRDKKRVDKHVPMHLRRKMRQEKPKPATFEMMPPTGVLLPGQKQNVQVKFMPTEERNYEQRIGIRLEQSSQRILLLCRGQGLEPQIELDRNLIEFGPILPHSVGDEQEVVIRNPCKFPVEIYNLEFDKTYLEEEKILRLMKGYDEFNTILLPPRPAGEKLPQELMDYYEEQMKKLEEQEKVRREAEEAEATRRAEQEQLGTDTQAEAPDTARDGADTTASKSELAPPTMTITSHQSVVDGEEQGSKTDRSQEEKREAKESVKDQEDDKPSDGESSIGVGELEITPVSAAIARHLGIDLSTEGKAARNRRGIAVIVHGAPSSGKTTLSIQIAKHFEAALLTIDGVVLEAISNGNTPAGLKARELCSEAAHRVAEELKAAEAEGGDVVGDVKKGPAAAGGLSVEAVTAHTQGTGGHEGKPLHAPSTVISNRKTSTISDPKSKAAKQASDAGKTGAISSGEGGSQDLGTARSDTTTDGSHRTKSFKRAMKDVEKQAASSMVTEQVPSSPPPLVAPIARRLSVSASVAGEEGLLSCVLPDDVLVDILAERLMLNDCHKGIVLDGLETLFSQNHISTCNAILRALNNRKYMHFVTLKQDYNLLKEQEKKAQEEKERLEQEAEDAERRRLEEMSEEEYDAMTEAQKAAVDRKRLEIKKERLRKEMEERQEKERREREEKEAELRRLEEEKINKKKKKGGADAGPGKTADGKKSQAAGKADPKSVERMGTMKSQDGKHDDDHKMEKTKSGMERPESHMTNRDRAESALDEGRRKKGEKATSKEGKRSANENERKGKKGKDAKGEMPVEDEEPQEEVPKLSEQELLLLQKFKTFEHSFKDIKELVEHWERSSGICRPSTPLEGGEQEAVETTDKAHPQSGRKTKKNEKSEKKVDKSEKAKESREQLSQQEGEEDQTPPLTEEERREKRLEEGIGLPHACIDIVEKLPNILQIVLELGKFPSMEEVLDGLGMGPKGPPIPPDASFGVVPYPVKRHAPPGAEGGHYFFVASGPDDPNVALEEKSADTDGGDEDKSATPDQLHDKQTPTGKSRGKSKDRDRDSDKEGSSRKEKKSKQGSAKSRQTGRRNSNQAMTPPPGATTPSETEGSTTVGDFVQETGKAARLSSFRWMIPAEGEVVIRLRFTSEDLGQFDQTLNFEITGTRRRYQLYCRGVCAFPTISREPRIVFPHRKKSKKFDEIVEKKYILATETFEFGPLLVGKPRDRYKEGKYPENMEVLTVLNTSPLDADISFCFLNDSKGDTFLLEPPTMNLKPGDQEELKIWAYPKTPQTFEDCLVCCIKENPEPITFKLLCHGVRPELELDKKTLQFERVLLHRKDTKTLYLRNSTLLPVAWRLNGLENLGDDFSVSQESGVIPARSEFALHAYFRAMKPVTTSRRSIRLEVSDDTNIMGIVQTENIQVIAEAYDVILDMTFPKGADGGIDFDVIRVFSEEKHTCSLKNKGRYDIEYKFTFEPTESCPQDVCNMFSVLPNRGLLAPNDKAAPVQVVFKANKEVCVKDQPILRCMVVEPSLGDDGETIASIPIKMSVKSVFSKYNIQPINDINFGSMAVPSKKPRTFVIENKGERFEFKYTISKKVHESPTREDRRSKRADRNADKKSRDGSSSGRSAIRPRRAESLSEVVANEPSKLKHYILTEELHGPVTLRKVHPRPKRCQLDRVPLMDRPFKPVAASKLGIVLLPPLKQSSRHVEASLQSVSYKSSHLSSDEEEEASDLGDLATYRQKRKSKRVVSKPSSVGKTVSQVSNKASRTSRIHVPLGELPPSLAKYKPAPAPPPTDDKQKSTRPAPKPKQTRRQEGPGGAGGGQTRLQLGAFTISPAMYTISPGYSQTITVECTADIPGHYEEEIVIDITGRDPHDNPLGIPYKMIGEACTQAINTTDFGSIFEEHHICTNLSLWQQANAMKRGGVYSEMENKFVFNNVLVGTKAKARFKISNPNKVPCDVLFTVKPVVTRATSKFTDVFEVEPPRAQIAAHSSVFAVVSFSPPSMQPFSAFFEASLEGVPQNQAKGRNLTFEVCGEGNLPRIKVMKPSVINKKGQALLLFKRNLVGRSQTMPLILINDGTLPSKVDIDLTDIDGVFSLQPVGETNAVSFITENTSSNGSNARKPHSASVIVDVNQRATFDVIFTPKQCQRSQGHLKLSVADNQYEDSVVQLVGEGYEDDVTVDNIRQIDTYVDPENEEGNNADDNVAAAKANHVKFGDCHINDSKTLTFTMTNHHKTDCIRFTWPDHPQLTFSPKVGHLHGGCTKDFSLTLKADKPIKLEECEIPAKVCKITFDKPVSEVADWDDRLRSVKWVDANLGTKPTSAGSGSGIKTPVDSAPTRPAKKKVIETAVEPSYQEVTDTARTIDLLVSANADYSQFKCKTESVHFKDTLMLQTRVYEFSLQNKGTISMDYSWQVVMDSYGASPGPRSVTFATHTHTEDERPMTAATGAMVVREEKDRPTSAASSIVSEREPFVPFSIEPELGTILPGKKADFKVKFSPLDVNEYEGRLVCSIPNLEDKQGLRQGPVIGLKARSLLPYCHFELEDSDYIRSARRNPELRGPRGAPAGTTLDPNTRVIEFKNIGVNVKNVRKFHIVNPTSQEYTFNWVNEDEVNPKKTPEFTCLTPEGSIRSGKKAEVAFEFSSSCPELVESFWRFNIPDQNISVPFLLVGHTFDPNVAFERSHLNFKALLIGHQATETVQIINSEEIPMHFSFEETSLFAPGYSASLNVEPLSGWVQPKSSVPLSITFAPTTESEVNFNLQCVVKKKTLPLTLNVKAEGYSMNCLVLCEDSTGTKVQLSPQNLNQINFGEVEVNEKSVRNIHIVNSGKFNFDYEWVLRERTAGGDSMVSMMPPSGGVMFGETQQCQLAFCPPRQTILRGCELLLKISHGPTYNIQVMGTGVLPGLHLSFHYFNFGPCFIQRGGMPAHTATLKLTNTDKKEISVDCLYTPTNHLHHNFEAQVIPAGQTVDVQFTFCPRQAIKYEECVEFEVNGLSKQTLEVLGQGTELKVEVVDPKQKIVKFGALRIGQTVKKQVPIVNKSPAPITFKLGFTPSNTILNDRSVLKFSPTGDISLEPRGGTVKVDLTFSPKTRIPQFSEEMLMECAGLSQPLFVVGGCCQGIEITLDTDYIPFGSVVQKSSSSRKLIMVNNGDIGARFKWDTKKFAPDFSISPTEGYISPGMEVPFDVAFHPQDINNDIRYDNLRCMIEGAKPLKLILTGSCIAMPTTREVVHFTTHVRIKETKNINVPNRTNMHWNLRPSIDGEYYSGPDAFVVEPMSTKPFEVSYLPLTMTTEGKKHMGTVFFPLPDGTGLLYNLSGTAEAPKAVNKITRDVPCKTSYTELLPVQNWLKKPQRFKVKIEMMRPDKLDPGTTVKGLDYIDVPGNSNRDYKLAFYAHKEGHSQIKILFQNEQTTEFQFYEVLFRSTRPGTIRMVELSTPVRMSVPYSIRMENPLASSVTFQATCTNQEILMPPTLQVHANSENDFNFEYLPLKTGETEAKLEFLHNDLGLYTYDLKLKATPAGPERALYFRTPLGIVQTQTTRFMNFYKQKTDYTCTVDNKDFHAEKTINAAPGSSSGTEVTFEVTYEPSRIGESRGTLTVSSPQGGDYTFPLFGACITPKPQGPFIVKAGATTAISFRNVFPSPTPFIFQVDNPLFHLTKTTDNIRARKDHRIVVGFDGNDSGSKAAVMGKLTVSCAKSAGGSSNAQWIYYLKGVTPEVEKKN